MAPKTIHAHIYDPSKALFFKPKANEKAELHTVTCNRSEDCGVFARGECIARQMFSGCKYGRATRETGFTRRASKYRQWIKDAGERVQGVGQLRGATDKVSRVGDYVWLPYSHMASARTGQSNLVQSWSDNFVPAEEFTADMIVHLCEARPQALFGGEVTTYQRDSVPSFISHLAEEYPEMLTEAAERSERIRTLLCNLTKVGRKALLHTLIPNVGAFKGWVWDGTYLTATGKVAENVGTLYNPVKGTEVRILPVEDAEVVITDDGQVGPDTVFVD